MKMLSRISLPVDRVLVNIRPWDGRYGLCPRSFESHEPSLVVDLDSGRAVCEVSPALNWDQYMTRLFWINDTEVLAIGDGHWWRVNYRTGKGIAKGTIDIEKQNPLYNGRGELTEDGKKLLDMHNGGKCTPPWTVDVTDVATLRCSTLGEVKTEHWPEGPCGLVPGGKYFHLGTQIYDRQSLKPVAAREFPHMEITAIVFSADGSRYAAVMWKAREEDDRDWWRHRDPETESLVRVQET